MPTGNRQCRARPNAPMAEPSGYAMQIGAFCILVVVQSAAILLFKLCQQDGKYTFNPASSVALTEVCKLGLSLSLHLQYVSSSKKPFWRGVTVQALPIPRPLNIRLIFRLLRR